MASLLANGKFLNSSNVAAVGRSACTCTGQQSREALNALTMSWNGARNSAGKLVQSWPNASLSMRDKTIEESSVAVCDFASNGHGVRVAVDWNSVCYS